MKVIKTFDFCAGHRLQHHESKCRHLHGHNWRVKVSVYGHELDQCGRLIDFSVIKDRVKGWVDANLDHGFILQCEDTEALAAVRLVKGQKLFMMTEPPTAENIARLILAHARPLLATDHVEVSVMETPTSEATCTE